MLTRMSGRLVVALGVVAILSAVAEGAPVPFDFFNSPASGVQTVSGPAGGGNPSPAVPASNFQSGLGGILFGNQRTITAQRQGGSDTFGATVNTAIANQYSFANGASTGSVFTINYDFAAQGFALDFSGSDLLTLVGIDMDSGSADFSITATDGTNSFTTPIQNVNSAAPITNLNFNIVGGLVDGSAITGITISVDTFNPGLSGADGQFDDILLDDTVTITGNHVPEPASMALFGLVGLGGMIAARRKMRKNRA